MNRTHLFNSNDPSLIDACRGAAAARTASALIILVGILAVTVMAACSPSTAIDPGARAAASEATVESSTPTAPATTVDEMLLDPDEIRNYTSNVHG